MIRESSLRVIAPMILLLMALTGACTTLRVGNDYDRQAQFGGYHRFSWLPRAHSTGGNPLIEQRARDAVQASLTAKGYTYVDDPTVADFAIDVTIGARDRIDIQSYPGPYAGPWGWDRRGWWGYPYWGSAIDVTSYREGTLSVDMFDTQSHRPVWHGWAKKDLSQSDIDHPGTPIRDAVAAVLAQFPHKWY